MPADNVVDRFIKGLEHLEKTGDLEPLVSLFSDECEVSNALIPGALKGKSGARTFWKSYRSHFHEIHSTFRMILSASGKAALEWQSRGSTHEGSSVEYEGTSVLEYNDDSITRFVAYFDPSAVGVSIESGLRAE